MGLDRAEPQPAAEPQPVPQDAVGRRVQSGGYRATVRYRGLVPPTEGEWLGVEWDDPERGKHDGSHDGVQYFTCRRPGAGSFLRASRLSFGVDFLWAVRGRYQCERGEVLSCASQQSVSWERLQERSLDSLPSLLLGQSEVSGPGAEGEIQRSTPNVQWLDLSATLLSSWEDVAAICLQLEHLEGLQLSSNRLRLPPDVSSLCSSFCNLRVLAVNSCELSWSQILDCAPMWPQLEDLSVEDNNIRELQSPDGVLQQLKILNLSSNPLLQDTVLSLSALPRLEDLNLAQTGLSHLSFDDAAPGNQTSQFPKLKILNLDQNHISEWGVIDELSKLSSLVKLSCRSNRLVAADGNPQTANQLLIAKLGRLQLLNSCEIHPEDRRGAELDYIKMFGAQWLEESGGGATAPSSHFTNQHPRYLSLIQKYGAPEEAELKKPEQFALKNQLLRIMFLFPDEPDRKPIERKLPASMLVQKVKGFLFRLLRVQAEDLRLSYTSNKMVGTEFLLDSDLKTLQFYSIEDGDQVLVRWS